MLECQSQAITITDKLIIVMIYDMAWLLTLTTGISYLGLADTLSVCQGKVIRKQMEYRYH